MKISDSSSVFSTSAAKSKSQSSDESAFSAFMDSVGSAGTTEKLPDDIATSSADGSLSSSDDDADAHHQDLVDELHKWANMNPAEMIRAKYLSSHNLSEDALQKLPPDVRQQIEGEIKKQVEEQAKQQASSANDAMSALSL